LTFRRLNFLSHSIQFAQFVSFRFLSFLFIYRPFLSFLISTAFDVLQATDSESTTNSRLATVIEAPHITPPGIRRAWCLASPDQSVQE
jgi:hypothetical protein